MKVVLLSAPDNALDVIYAACRTCTTVSVDYEKISCNTSTEHKEEFVTKVIDSGHTSVLDHVTVVFGISGITRACSQQLERHRHCGFSERSLRYVNVSSVDVSELFSPADDWQLPVLEELAARYKEAVIHYGKESARQLLPMCTNTNLVMSCNLTEMIHIAHERLCGKAETEIRDLVTSMCRLVSQKYHWIRPFLVPKCIWRGVCKERQPCTLQASKVLECYKAAFP